MTDDSDAPVQALLDALPEPCLAVSEGMVIGSNAAARAVLGAWIDGEDVRLVLRQPAALDRLLGDVAGSEEVELVSLGGPERRWMMTVAPLGETVRLARLFDRSEAYAAEQMRVDFVANASHELRTPLATLVGYAETLREQGDEIDSVTRERFTAIIHDEARRMQRLVEDLISLSRIEGERFTQLTDLLALAPLIEEARVNCANHAAERGCRVEIEAADTLPRILGDRSQLLQLLDNLIGNAIRYGRAEGLIRARVTREGEMLRLSIADQGEGIPAEHIPRITERFYRVDASRSRALGGTGLGLSIVKHIVERHRGRLFIESRVGQGTIVHVLLPAAQPGLSQ
ncbi:MAG TPA: ATP-binding protein [Allosphingosinicella sp.]|jgi:two-component system phosphate regulon sensor histidine kinase PhoR